MSKPFNAEAAENAKDNAPLRDLRTALLCLFAAIALFPSVAAEPHWEISKAKSDSCNRPFYCGVADVIIWWGAKPAPSCAIAFDAIHPPGAPPLTKGNSVESTWASFMIRPIRATTSGFAAATSRVSPMSAARS